MKSTMTQRSDRTREKSRVQKKSIVIYGHKTSISVEEAFWTALKAMAASQNVRISELVATIDRARKYNNLSSGIRLYVLDYYRGLTAGR
jgi:predicted DNA-binding ribbon-helix-helix protein